MMTNCDMCGSKIVNSRCLCGTWKSKEEMKDNPLGEALKFFNKEERFTLTCDAPHLGCAVVFFRGDYKDCKAVEKFIYQLKCRPYYENN